MPGTIPLAPARSASARPCSYPWLTAKSGLRRAASMTYASSGPSPEESLTPATPGISMSASTQAGVSGVA